MSVASWLCKKKINAPNNDPLLCTLSQLVLDVELVKPASEWRQGGDGFEDGWERRMEEMNKEWGLLVSHYLKCHWECVLCYKSLTASVKHVTTNAITLSCTDTVQLAKAYTDSMDTSSNDAIVTICKCMTLLVPEVKPTCFQLYIN